MNVDIIEELAKALKNNIDDCFIAWINNGGKPVYDFSNTELLMKSLKYDKCPTCQSNNVSMVKYKVNEGQDGSITYYKVICNDCETSTKAESVYSNSDEEAIIKAHKNWHRRKNNG